MIDRPTDDHQRTTYQVASPKSQNGTEIGVRYVMDQWTRALMSVVAGCYNAG